MKKLTPEEQKQRDEWEYAQSKKRKENDLAAHHEQEFEDEFFETRNGFFHQLDFNKD